MSTRVSQALGGIHGAKNLLALLLTWLEAYKEFDKEEAWEHSPELHGAEAILINTGHYLKAVLSCLDVVPERSVLDDMSFEEFQILLAREISPKEKQTAAAVSS